jgi:pimeloyl-ACP methyl ester carboxylesterase
MRKINQNFPITYPSSLYESLVNLGKRGLMTPSYISPLIMSALLPSTVIVERNNPLQNYNSQCTKDSILKRTCEMHDNIGLFNQHYQHVTNTHTLEKVTIEGLESLRAQMKQQPANGAPYEIYFCGNAQDAMPIFTASARIAAEPQKNHLFWNYPGVGFSRGSTDSPDDLIKAGYQQVKFLLGEGIPANKITLYGFSMGGGVAAQVARQLHKEGLMVHLTIDRSFANLASVGSECIKAFLAEPEYTHIAPLCTSILACGVAVFSLGTTFAGLVATTGLLTDNAITTVGLMVAYFVRAMGIFMQAFVSLIGEIIAFPFSLFSQKVSNDIKEWFDRMGESLSYGANFISQGIYEAIATIAWVIDCSVNFIGSLAGGAIALAGFLGGCLLGLITGAVLSLQLCWTDKPVTMPMSPAFSAGLYSSCCELNSVNAIRDIVAIDTLPKHQDKAPAEIQVINTLDDEVIRVNASLNKGLNFKPGVVPNNEERQPLRNKVTSFWYRNGGHGGHASNPIHPGEDIGYQA